MRSPVSVTVVVPMVPMVSVMSITRVMPVVLVSVLHLVEVAYVWVMTWIVDPVLGRHVGRHRVGQGSFPGKGLTASPTQESCHRQYCY
jgi:hypothetical protein